MSFTLIIIVLAMLAIPLVIGSVFVCVPKWWTKSVSPRLPHMPDWATKDLPISSKIEDRMFIALAILITPPLLIVALVVWLIRGWFVIGLATIEGVCPYNGNFKWREELSDWFSVGMKPFQELDPEDIVGGRIDP